MLNKLVQQYKEIQKELSDIEQSFEEISHTYELHRNMLALKKQSLQDTIDKIDNEIRGGDKQLTFDKQEVEGVVIKTRLQPRKVIVSDVEALPEQFKRVKYEADKKALKQALESGESVQGAEFSTEEYKVYCE